MSVSIVWSYTNGGSAISDYVDHENASNGTSTTAKNIYVRHDGVNDITSAKLYIREFSGTYNGDATASADLAELLAWGDAATAAAFGGVMLNWGGAATWPTYADKSPADSFVHRTGVGDSELNAETIPTAAGVPTAGTIPFGASPGVMFSVRIDVPTDEDTVGVRLFDQVMSYSYTS